MDVVSNEYLKGTLRVLKVVGRIHNKYIERVWPLVEKGNNDEIVETIKVERNRE